MTKHYTHILISNNRIICCRKIQKITLLLLPKSIRHNYLHITDSHTVWDYNLAYSQLFFLRMIFKKKLKYKNVCVFCHLWFVPSDRKLVLTIFNTLCFGVAKILSVHFVVVEINVTHILICSQCTVDGKFSRKARTKFQFLL